MEQFYSEYQTQLNTLKKKHLQEQQQLEQKLLSQRQELERQMSENNYYGNWSTNNTDNWNLNEKESLFPSPTLLNRQPSPNVLLENDFQEPLFPFPETFNSDSINFANIAPSPNEPLLSPSLKEAKVTLNSNNNKFSNLLSAKAASSRHISSVISHFTGNSEAFTRLAHELDGFLFILSASGHVLFASNSCQSFLGFPQNSMIGHSIKDYLHPEDEQLVMNHLCSSIHDESTLSVFCRFKKGQQAILDSQDCILMEMVARPVFEKAGVTPIFLVNVGREYQSKTTMELDSILALRMENIKLRLKLKCELERQGKDPVNHHLLQIANNDNAQFHEQVPVMNAKQGSTPFPGIVEKLDMKKRKKQKIPTDELVCRQCGTNSSPEWRRGPTGPKTYFLFLKCII